MYPHMQQYSCKAPTTAFASNRCRFGSNVTGTACHCTTHCWFASCLPEQTLMCTSRRDHRCGGHGKRIRNSATRRGQESPFQERRSIKLAIAWQRSRARNGWPVQSDQVFWSCLSAEPRESGHHRIHVVWAQWDRSCALQGGRFQHMLLSALHCSI